MIEAGVEVLFLQKKNSAGGPTLGALTGPPTLKHRANPPSFDLNPVCMKSVSYAITFAILTRRCSCFFQFVVVFITYLR
jgi:hypothetical protein